MQHTNARRDTLIHKCNPTHMFKPSRLCTYTDPSLSHTHTHARWSYDSEGSSWKEGSGAGGELVTIWISSRLPRFSADGTNQRPAAVQSLGFDLKGPCRKRVRKRTENGILAAREQDDSYTEAPLLFNPPKALSSFREGETSSLG